MPRVEVTVSVEIPQGATIAELEQCAAAELRRAGKQLLADGIAALEEAALTRQQCYRDRRRPLDLLSCFGWVRLERLYVRDARSGRYRYLVEVGSRQEHATPSVVDWAVLLATRLPYRQAAQLLGRLLDEAVDHRTLYGWVKAEGQVLVDKERQLQESVFEDGEVPPSDDEERELVVAVVDGTYLKAQREGQPSFEVRIGVAYSGRELVSATARHRRYRLRERQLYAGVDTAQDFAERFYLACEEQLALGHARHLLVVGDGAEWIEALAGHERYKATYQLDHWHILEHARRVFGGRPQVVAELARALHEGDTGRVLRIVSVARLAAEADADHLRQFESYLRTNLHGIHGARRLRTHLSPEGQLAAVEGSGAVEKQGDLLVSRRFEHAGMRWTKAGANRLLKLRLKELARAA
jgi:hypothetical protein